MLLFALWILSRIIGQESFTGYVRISFSHFSMPDPYSDVQVAARVSSSLTAAGLSNIVDTTGTTIGKRYSRTDEIGVPFAITVRLVVGKRLHNVHEATSDRQGDALWD